MYIGRTEKQYKRKISFCSLIFLSYQRSNKTRSRLWNEKKNTSNFFLKNEMSILFCSVRIFHFVNHLLLPRQLLLA